MAKLSYLSLLKYLVVADFKSDVNRYFFGLFLWFAEPLMYVAVFYVAFSHLRSGDEGYIYFLIVGITTWRWLAGSISTATNSIVGKKQIISHFSVNPVVFTVSSLISHWFKFVVLLTGICGFLAYVGRLDFAGVAMFSLWFSATFTCLLACSLVSAYLVVYVPDTKVFIGQGLLLLMFLSGVIYPLDKVSAEIMSVLQFNPFLHIISGIRFLLMGHGEMPLMALTIVTAVSTFSLCLLAIFSAKVSTDIPKRVLL